MKTINDMDALISKFLLGEASPEEAMRLEDWMKESPENCAYFDQSAKTFGLIEKEISVNDAWLKVFPKIKQAPIRKLSMSWISAAAAVLILAVGTFYILQNNDEVSVFTANDKQKNVELNDGTDIELAAHSSIELSPEYGKNNRSLILKGSGYFSVKHSKALPFIIESGPIHIKDLGTKFDVKTTDDTIYVRVDEGVVMIYDNKGMKITLKANERAHYVISTGDLQLDVLAENLKSESKTIILDDQRLEDIVQLLNKVYKVDIRIENPALNNCRITTEFMNEDLETVLLVIAQTLEVTIKKEGEVYWIKGQACNQ